MAVWWFLRSCGLLDAVMYERLLEAASPCGRAVDAWKGRGSAASSALPGQLRIYEDAGHPRGPVTRNYAILELGWSVTARGRGESADTEE